MSTEKKKKVDLKWNISTEMARAGERYLQCVAKANTPKDQFSIDANKTSTLWHSVLLPFNFFYFFNNSGSCGRGQKAKKHHLWYPTSADVNGPFLGDFVGIGFVHSLPLGWVSEQNQVGRTLKQHLQQCKFPVPPSWVYPGCRRHSHATALILNPAILNLL